MAQLPELRSYRLWISDQSYKSNPWPSAEWKSAWTMNIPRRVQSLRGLSWVNLFKTDTCTNYFECSAAKFYLSKHTRSQSDKLPVRWARRVLLCEQLGRSCWGCYWFYRLELCVPCAGGIWSKSLLVCLMKGCPTNHAVKWSENSSEQAKISNKIEDWLREGDTIIVKPQTQR